MPEHSPGKSISNTHHLKIMGKKTTTAKTAAPAKRAARPAAAKPPATVKKSASGTKPPKAAAAPKRAAKAPGYTNDDVALRAYFIAEKRRNHGLSGDERHDWLEAERQLLAESKAPKKPRAAKA